MGHKSKGDSGEYEFSKAAYDELEVAQKRYEVQFVLSLEPAGQRGVWALAVVAVPDRGDDGIAYVARWQGTWPNAVAISYGAFLYAACHRCVRMVEAWHATRAQEDATRH